MPCGLAPQDEGESVGDEIVPDAAFAIGTTTALEAAIDRAKKRIRGQTRNALNWTQSPSQSGHPRQLCCQTKYRHRIVTVKYVSDEPADIGKSRICCSLSIERTSDHQAPQAQEKHNEA
jgi:hypothetical protein